jgi:membrane protease YdiL (CAAX protease family)
MVPLSAAYSVALRLSLLVLAVLVSFVLIVTNVVNLDQLQQTAKANQPDVSALVDISALSHSPLYWWLSLTLVSFVVAGLREELWRTGFLAGLRGLWPGAFGSTRGQLVGVCIAAIIFGLGHLAMGPLACIMAGILGLGLGAIMVLHRSIWPAVIAHGMFDATTFALLPLIADLMRHSH